MKKLLLLPVLAIFALSAAHVTTFTVDPAASTIVWTGYKVTGQHTGNVTVKNGKLLVDHGRFTGGSFEIDMTTITCTDLQGGGATKLVNHLKSDDFFGVEKYPMAKYVITRVIPTDTKGNYKIIGDLTIKEKTKEVRFNANLAEANNQLTATAKIVVDRSDFDVKFGSGSFFDGLGDKTIYDDFDLQVTLVAK
jgi:polyisoprenoid-binding protein YceI